jgi:uncharacterized protein (TIGR03437 family)
MLNPQVEPTNIFLQYFQGTDPTQVTASFTISTSDNSGFSIGPVPLSWLILSTRSGAVTPAAIRVGINPAGLAPGTYSTGETVTFVDNTRIAVNITLQVVGLPNLSTDLPTGVTGLTFTAPAGSTTVQSQSLRIFSSIRGVTADVTTSGEAWLGANPSPGIARLAPLRRVATPKNAGLVAGASASTPFTLRATANPTGLAAGKYTATITLTSAQAGNSPFTIPVTFNIAEPPQSIAVNAVVNAASLLSNSAAPYTIVTAFGTFPGCTSGAQVSVNGSSVLVFYSSTTQINFLLPSSLGTALSASIQVSCAGLTAASVTVPLAPYAPAIITTTQDGKGQAAIINQDHTMETPAPIGSVIEVYGTGFGVLGPKGSDGLSRTMVPVTAFVGDVPATVTYAGEAPTWQGLQQIDVQIPAGAPHGAAVSLRLVINGIGTQPGVTIAVL